MIDLESQVTWESIHLHLPVYQLPPEAPLLEVWKPQLLSNYLLALVILVLSFPFPPLTLTFPNSNIVDRIMGETLGETPEQLRPEKRKAPPVDTNIELSSRSSPSLLYLYSINLI